MTSYLCPRCNFHSTLRCAYRKHLQRKNPCKAIYNQIEIQELLNQLADLPKKTGQQYTIFRECIEELKNEIVELKRKTHAYETEYQSRKSNQNHPHERSNTSHKFGKEYTGHINRAYLDRLDALCESDPHCMVTKTISDIFFNSNLPENKTFKAFINHNDEYHVHLGMDTWVAKEKTWVIRCIIEKTLDTIEYTYGDLPEHLRDYISCYYNDFNNVPANMTSSVTTLLM